MTLQQIKDSIKTKVIPCGPIKQMVATFHLSCSIQFDPAAREDEAKLEEAAKEHLTKIIGQAFKDG